MLSPLFKGLDDIRNRRFHDECDYSTDSENVRKDSKMLIHDVCLAIEFYLQDAPLELVRNVR